MDRLSGAAAPEGVVSGFTAHLGRALRCWRVDPRLPLVALAIAGMQIASRAGDVVLDSDLPSFGGLLLMIATVGFLGTIRIWYLAIEAGERLPAGALYTGSKRFWGRFVRLGLLIGVIAAIPTFIAVAVRESHEVAGTLALLAVWLVVDVLLTFAPAALACYDIPAGRALGYSWQVTKAQWPASAPYALAVPLALTFTLTVLPIRSTPIALYVAVAMVLAVLALACKGATVLFYADRYLTTPPAPGTAPLDGEVTPG